jgi:hypothetical protein
VRAGRSVIGVVVCVWWIAAGRVSAATTDVTTVFSNVGFELGNLSGWSVTRPNSDYVVSLSPAVNPTIDPADPANDPTTLTALARIYSTGSPDCICCVAAEIGQTNREEPLSLP